MALLFRRLLFGMIGKYLWRRFQESRRRGSARPVR
jgi:hypothetical protein